MTVQPHDDGQKKINEGIALLKQLGQENHRKKEASRKSKEHERYGLERSGDSLSEVDESDEDCDEEYDSESGYESEEISNIKETVQRIEADVAEMKRMFTTIWSLPSVTAMRIQKKFSQRGYARR